ncbi:MAG: tetratricopeptide repeat protein, partial [Rhizobiales bacterium]|nr:tetratricopeptide repeat protein [Hyphomicrobiales bacterium]
MSALSDAPEIRRNAARLDIARFYLAREMYPEARGPLNVIIGNERDNDEIARALVLRGIASLMMNQAHEALRDFNNPVVGPQFDGDLWRALALSRVGRYADAREGLRQTAAASAGLPIELQRYALAESARCAIELGDYADAARQL